MGIESSSIQKKMLKMILIWLNYGNTAFLFFFNFFTVTFIHPSFEGYFDFFLLLLEFFALIYSSLNSMHHASQYRDKTNKNKGTQWSHCMKLELITLTLSQESSVPLSDTIKKSRQMLSTHPWSYVPLQILSIWAANSSSLESANGISKSPDTEKMPVSKKWAWLFLWVMRFPLPRRKIRTSQSEVGLLHKWRMQSPCSLYSSLS